MKQLIKQLARKISPTAIAIFIVGGAVLAGGATAAVQGMINGKKIKPNTVTTKQIKNRTIVRSDIDGKTWKQLKGQDGLVGPIGPKGETGAPGSKGDTGPAGAPGTDGTDGTDGTNGTNGTDGEVGPTGATGLDGADGSDGVTGPTGPTGDDGATGATGPAGSVEYQGVNWGVDYRNTIGSPVAQLRAGPAVAPYGIGALGLQVGDSAAHSERIAFSNEVDVLVEDNLVANLSEVGFQVYTTNENSALGYNMPNIAIEIDPNGAGGTTTEYSTMLFRPADNSPGSEWSGYIDGTTSGNWGLTGSAFTGEDCWFSASGCSFDEMQAFLATGSGAEIISVGISKGRDKAWNGAVDGLRINGDVFDFEPFGVSMVTPAP